jgi:peptidoglycan/LPS O-acetylase OafA/YrhL
MTPSAASSRPEIAQLTSLRFFAALIVLMYHVGARQAPPWLPHITTGWFASGLEAVAFFFVLSGFVLSYAYSDSHNATRQIVTATFLKARFARLAPTYYLGLLIALPAMIYSTFISGLTPLLEFASGLVLVPLFLQSWFPPASLAWNMPSWSLSVEFFFYVMFPALIGLARRVSVRNLFFFAAVLAAFTAALHQLAIFHLAAERPAADVLARFSHYFPPLHIGEFVFGFALARLFICCQKLSPRACDVLFVACSLVVGSLLGLRGTLPEWTRWYGFLIPIFGALVYFTASSRLAAKLLGGRWLVLLGEASYPLYILHMPILFWLAQVGKWWPAELSSDSLSFFLGPANCVIVALLVTVFYERAAHTFLKKRLAGTGPRGSSSADSSEVRIS